MALPLLLVVSFCCCLRLLLEGSSLRPCLCLELSSVCARRAEESRCSLCGSVAGVEYLRPLVCLPLLAAGGSLYLLPAAADLPLSPCLVAGVLAACLAGAFLSLPALRVCAAASSSNSCGCRG